MKPEYRAVIVQSLADSNRIVTMHSEWVRDRDVAQALVEEHAPYENEWGEPIKGYVERKEVAE